MVDWSAVRDDFPIVKRTVRGKSIIYFDSAGMSLRPYPVMQAMDGYYTAMSSCGGNRAAHALALETNEACAEARSEVAQFIGARRDDEVIWTRNTTEALNLVSHAWPWRRERGGNIVTTLLEHHSGVLPFWKATQAHDLQLRVVETDSCGRMDIARFEDAIDDRTQMVSVVMASNFTGTYAPISEICKLAHRHGAAVIGDGAQYVPHRSTQVGSLGLDFLAFSAHKMLGPSGMGVLWGKYDLLDRTLDTFMVGGDTVVDVEYRNGEIVPSFKPPPGKFEAGLQNYAGIIGTGAAVQYLKKLGMEQVERREQELKTALFDAMEKVPKLEVVGPPLSERANRGALLTFKVPASTFSDPKELVMYMDEVADVPVMMRTGGHCSHPFQYRYGLDPKKGTARVSLYIYNTPEECQLFAAELKEAFAAA